ncbi:MAG TPA: protein kinase, partial [bacterium]|nr:protein kinase [bacterium]
MAPKKTAKKKSDSDRIAGRYRRLRALGRGGGGAVYLVEDSLGEPEKLALKVVEKVPGLDPAMADLKNEFATLSLLQHPNLAAVRDFGSTEKEVYFTAEWVDGEDFLAATSGADLNRVFQLILQVLRALDYIHQRGVLHLDLKPANILVTDPDRTGELSVKLIDFGIAQWKKQGRIASGGFSGSPPYAAPEMLMEREVGPATDIYSLGMLLHQVFARRFPFATQNPQEIMMRQTYEDPRPIENLDPALPPGFANLLHRMVAREPATRISSARETLEQLNLCLGENFSIRSPRAPAHLLEESDHLFHPEILEELRRRLSGRERIELWGPAGTGKTRTLDRLKALLQQSGEAPLHFRDSASWREYVELAGGSGDRTLLLDWNEAPDPATIAAFAGAVLWTRRDSASQAAPAESVRLPDLTEASLAPFLGAEIREAPPGLAAQLLQAPEAKRPAGLEKVLQALREEGSLVWGSAGWNWQGEAPAEVAGLLQRQAGRDEEKRRAAREFLEASGLALPGHALEGLLGFEAGALRDLLRQWLTEGWLRQEIRKGLSYYSVAGANPQAGEGSGRDPEAAARQLNALYDQGNFAAGVAWIEEWLRRTGLQALPSEVALAGARHLVAEGRAERALALLEGREVSDPKSSGMFHETRARAENLLGRFEVAAASLTEAEKHYQSVSDGRGLARVHNLRGVLGRAARDWNRAEEQFALAVELATQAGDLYCAGIAQTNLALVYQDQGKVEAAYEGYRQAWDLARREPHPFLLQSLYQKWINLLHHGGKSAEAEAACYEWMKLTLRHRYRDQQAIALNYLSLIAGRRGHLELKAAYLDQALALLDESKQPRFLAQLLVNRAYLNWSLQKFLPAQLDAEAALNVGRLWPEDRLLGWVDIILGKIYRDRPKPDWDKSAEFFDRARANILKNENLESLWEV